LHKFGEIQFLNQILKDKTGKNKIAQRAILYDVQYVASSFKR